MPSAGLYHDIKYGQTDIKSKSSGYILHLAYRSCFIDTKCGNVLMLQLRFRVSFLVNSTQFPVIPGGLPEDQVLDTALSVRLMSGPKGTKCHKWRMSLSNVDEYLRNIIKSFSNLRSEMELVLWNR